MSDEYAAKVGAIHAMLVLSKREANHLNLNELHALVDSALAELQRAVTVELAKPTQH